MSDDTRDDDWTCVCTVDTPRAALPAIIDRWTARTVRDYRQQLDDDPNLTPAERDRLAEKMRPHFARTTEAAITAGWLDLQAQRPVSDRAH